MKKNQTDCENYLKKAEQFFESDQIFLEV